AARIRKATERLATGAPVDVTQCRDRCPGPHDAGDVALTLAANSYGREPDRVTRSGEAAAQDVARNDVEGRAHGCGGIHEVRAVGHLGSRAETREDARFMIYEIRFAMYEVRGTIYEIRFTMYEVRCTRYDLRFR